MRKSVVGSIDQLDWVTGVRATRTDEAVVRRVDELELASEEKEGGRRECGQG